MFKVLWGKGYPQHKTKKRKKKKNQTCRMYTEHGNKNNLIIQINISYSN